MANKWSVNEEIVVDFEVYAESHMDAQPIYANKSCLSLTEIAVWPNRVPDHEPWARVLKQDELEPVNKENDNYLNNVDAKDQYDNETSPEGREPIGKVEGDETIDRNMFWRR